MSGRGEGPGNPRDWIRGAMVAAILVLVLVAGGLQGRLAPARMKPLHIAGLLVMVASLALSALSGRLAARFGESKRERAAMLFKLASVPLCAAGAMLVFIA